MSTELKPCPFCGSDDLRVEYSGSFGVWVQCACGGSGQHSPITDYAVAAWNTRAPELAAEVETLRDELENMALAIREFMQAEAGSPEEEDKVSALSVHLALYDLHHGPAAKDGGE